MADTINTTLSTSLNTGLNKQFYDRQLLASARVEEQAKAAVDAYCTNGGKKLGR